MFVITGGGSGIGRALAHELARRGKKVLIIGRRLLELQKTASFSSLINICCVDASTVVGRERINDALSNITQLAGLIHNAGVIEPINHLACISAADAQAPRILRLVVGRLIACQKLDYPC